MIQIKVLDAEKNIVAENGGQEEVNLTLRREYQEGDTIVFEIGGETGHYWMQVDDVLGKSLVYLTGDQTYEIPFEEKKFNLSPKAFTGEKQLLCLRKARPYEINIYRNLAENVNDQHGDVNCYPHASANVETRGEAVFAAKNAIDGVTANHDHGKWPFASWGINQRDDAEIKLEFGREISTDRIVLHIRADFPHDNWWVKGTVEFSDGSSMVLALEITSKFESRLLPQRISNNLRDMKNYTITLNTLLRKAAEQAGVHPIHIDAYSNCNVTMLESLTSATQCLRAQQTIALGYCRIVKEHQHKIHSSIIRKVVAYLETDLSADLTLNTLAQHFL